jgi:hypothetical protein
VISIGLIALRIRLLALLGGALVIACGAGGDSASADVVAVDLVAKHQR